MGEVLTEDQIQFAQERMDMGFGFPTTDPFGPSNIQTATIPKRPRLWGKQEAKRTACEWLKIKWWGTQ